MPADILCVLIAISLLILIHEIGHFLAARFFNIWVEEFGIGLPPRLFGIKKGETLYSLNLLPIGGFVKMHGEEEPHKPLQKPKRAFYNKKWWQRAIILTSGVLMNFLLGVLIISILFTKGVIIADGVEIGEIAVDSPAYQAGIEKGDLLLAINERKIIQINQATEVIKESLDQETSFKLQREFEDGTQIITVSAVPRLNPPQGQGALGVELIQKTTIKKYPFYQAPYFGLKSAINTSFMLIKGIASVFWQIIFGLKLPEDVAGPIGIYQLYGEARQYGFAAIMELTGLISLNLAVLNMFPIPPLDGARFVFVVVEGITHKKLKKEWEQKMYQISFLLLIILFIIISIQDIKRLFGL